MENNIKKQELRLGNYFLHDGNIVQFDEDIMHDVKYGGLEGDEPIPLTEEWLLKFGFEKKKDYNNRCYYSIDGMDIKIDGDEFATEVGECLYKRIKYVHQLQNLYFALNDEELTMK